MRTRMRRRTDGYVLIEVLLTLMTVVMMLPVTVLCIGLVHDLLPFRQTAQDEIALAQLRRILMISYDCEIQGDELYFEYRNEEYSLSLVNNRLIIQPGTQIFLTEIESASFVQKGDVIYVVFEREGDQREAAIALS